MSDSAGVVLAAVGDVVVNRIDPSTAFANVIQAFDEADIRFGNCEVPYTTTSERNPVSGLALSSDPRNLRALAEARFDVMSFASNHALDCGYSGLFETLQALTELGITPVGSGANRTVARRWATVQRGRKRVAFIARTCVYHPGFEAGLNKPGCATVQVHTIYRPHSTYYRTEPGQPGTKPDILTIADPADLAELQEDIGLARSEAEVVVVSMHWGIHNEPVVLTDYEKQLGHAAIDAGASIVVGHHQHILKGIEIYRDGVIFYGLGNFVFDFAADGLQPDQLDTLVDRYGSYATFPRPDYPTYPWHPDARMTVIATAVVSTKGVGDVGLRPCLINPAGQPTLLGADSPEFSSVVAYIEDISAKAGLRIRLERADSAVRVRQG